MDPVNPISGNPAALDQTSNTPKAKGPEPVERDNHGITIAAMAVFVLLSLAAVAFLYYQNQQLKSMLANYQAPTASTTPVATSDPTANWKTYTNDAGFSFKYPGTFAIGTPSQFGTPAADIKSLSSYVYDQGSQKPYDERYVNVDIVPAKYNVTVTQTQATVSGQPATKAVLGNVPFDLYTINLNGKYIEVYISNNPAKIGVANQILSTFQFTSTSTASPSAKPVACTQEAKVCPDGSSVGRTGPNCEFAACPGY